MQNLLGESTLVSAGQEARVTSLAAGVAPLNVNGDAVPDVLRYDPASGAWVMEPGGGLASSTGTWLPGRDVAPGDFDGNGLTDFLLHDSTSGAARVALNDAQGGFTEVDSSWAPGWRARVLNLNGDRWSDVFLHQPATGQWGQAIGQGGGSFLNIAGQWASGWEPHPLDLDGDDTADLLLFNAASGGWLWAVSDGAGAFAHPASGEWEGVTNVYPGDFTADGRWDALLYDSRTGAWSLATNTGSGFSYQTGTVATGAEFVVADLDGDGDDDALLYDSGSGQMSVHLAETLADGTARLVAATSTVWASNWRVSPTHFNTDGRADLLLYFAEGGRWVKAYYSGSETFPHLDEGSWPTGLSVLSGQSLTQGLLPNDAAQTACAAEYDLRPTDSTATTSIEVINASSGPRRLYWLNALGQRVLTRTLAAGERSVHLSPVGRSWVVTDTIGTCQAIYVAGNLPGRVVSR